MIRAYITETYGFSMGVSLVMHPPEGSFDTRARIFRFSDGRASWDEEIAEGDVIDKPSFWLDADSARALLAGLHQHFGGVDDSRALRRDYDDERRRADKLTDAVIEIARTATQSRAVPRRIGD